MLGHEVSGVVRQVGPGVTHVEPGDRVVASFIMPCGVCHHCSSGLEELCEEFFTKNRLAGQLLDGTTRLHRGNGEEVAMYSMGGHATHAVIPASAVFLLPDTVPLADAAILGCSLFTAYGAVFQTGHVHPGDTVAMVAAGGIGLSIIHLAAAAGAARIFVIDLDDEKLALATRLGATDVMLTGIAPPGHVLDAAIAHVVRRKITIRGSYGAAVSHAMPAVIDLAARGKLALGQLMTDRFSFDQTAAAYRALAARQITGRGLIEIHPEPMTADSAATTNSPGPESQLQ